MTDANSLIMGSSIPSATFNEIGVSDAHHPLSHHENDPTKLEKLAKIQAYQMQGFAQFLEKLQATRIVIAHRLSTIQNADRIFVIQGGSLIQSGTYKDLVDQPGLFSELAKRQLS